MPKPITNPHDKMFKAAMANHRVAKDFFQQYLPKHILEKLDIASLTLLQQSYLGDSLDESFSDLVYQCKLGESSGYLTVLVEHQSSADKFLPLRVYEYLFGLLNRRRKESPDQLLAPVYAVVFYHGEQTPYPYSMDILDCFNDTAGVMADFLANPVPLVDVNKLSDESLVKQRWIGPLSLAMKHIRQEDFGPALETILTKLDWPLNEMAFVELLQQFLLYLYTAGNLENANEYLEGCYEKVSEPVRRTLMTIAEQLETAGFKKGQSLGIEQGIEQGELVLLRKLLSKRFGELSEEVEDKLKQASKSELEAWAERIFEINSLSELFD